MVELDIQLTATHDGLPAGTEIQVGFAQAAVQTAPPAPSSTTTPTISTVTTTPTTTGPQPKTGPEATPPKGPQRAHPPLATGTTYDFPVFGPAPYRDTFGAPRAHETLHRGVDIFGTLGRPLVAVTDGTVFSVAYDKTDGNHLWLVDSAGNEFFYAHLAAFSTAARNGSLVRAGEVIGFMGNTGDAARTPVHLHFEVYPASLLYLGAAGAVDPATYLHGWQHLKKLPYPIAPAYAPNVHGLAAGPEPGAFLLGMSDISAADGLDPASLRRALQPSPAVSPSEAPTTAVTAPAGDLGPTYGPRRERYESCGPEPFVGG